MTIKESPQSRIYRDFGLRLDDRINMVAHDFQNTTDRLRVRMMKQFKKQLSGVSEGGHVLNSLDDMLAIQENILMLQENRFEDRGKIIKLIGVENILGEMRRNYQSYANNGKQGVANQDYAKSEYQKVLDNFEALFNEASVQLERMNGLDVTIEENDIDDEVGEEGASGNEGWGIRMHEVNLKDIVSGKTKRMLSLIPKYKSDNTSFETDDLGNVEYMDGEQVRKVLVEIMSHISSSEEFCVYDKTADKYVSFPILEEAQKKYKWIQPVITFLKRNPEYADSFYSDMRNDFYVYKTVKSVKDQDSNDATTRVVNQNERSNIETQLDQIKSTINEGRVLNKAFSIYNDKGRILVENIPAFEEKLKSLKTKIDALRDSDRVTKAFAGDLKKILEAIGYPVSTDELYESLNGTENTWKTLTDLHSVINQFFGNVKKNKSRSDNYLLFKDNQNFYKQIVELCGLMDGLTIT